MTKKLLAFFLLFIILTSLIITENLSAATADPEIFELAVNETYTSTFGGSISRTVKLISVTDYTELAYSGSTLVQVFFKADVVVEVSGVQATVICGPYQMPTIVNGLRISADLTRGSAGGTAAVPLDKDVRLSAKDGSLPWFDDGRFVFPVKGYRWRGSSYTHTWNGFVQMESGGIYYHRGEDLGAYPDKHDFVAVNSGEMQLYYPNGDGLSNTIMTQDSSLVYRYAHPNTSGLRTDLYVGSKIIQGEKIGKTGDLYKGSHVSDPHLHFEVRLKSDNITKLNTFPILVQAYQQTYPGELLALAGGFRFCRTGDTITLDGSKSIAATGRTITGYSWRFTDGTTASGVTAQRTYSSAGTYGEELTVTDNTGVTGTDYVIVRVFNPGNGNVPMAHLNYFPMRGIKVGTTVYFKFWNTNMSNVKVNFGDGTGDVTCSSSMTHSFSSPGEYVVKLFGDSSGGGPGIFKVKVVVEAADTTAPAMVNDLIVNSITPSSATLSWTARGDDGDIGTATEFDLRYNTSPVTEANWGGAAQANWEPNPAKPGSVPSMTIYGLTGNNTYYFAIKTGDEVFNWSALSNVPSGAAALDNIAPAAVSDLQVISANSSSVTLAWTAPGDDNNTGKAAGYDIRYSTTAINDTNWNSATQVSGEPAPNKAGERQFFTVSGLNSGVTYYFALKTSDEIPNPSALSNVPGGATKDASVLDYDNFEDGMIDGWSISYTTDWCLMTDGGYRMNGTNLNGEAIATRGSSWANYAVDAKMKLLNNMAADSETGIMARYIDAGNYYLFYYSKSSGAFKIGKKVSNSFSTLATGSAFTLNKNIDYHLRADLNGGVLKLYVDEALAVSATDSSLTTGKIGLKVYKINTDWDEITVTQGGTATPTPTPTPTPGPTATPTLTPNGGSLFSDNFEDGNADGWSGSTSYWSIVTDGTCRYRGNYLTGEAISINGVNTWTNYTVEAVVKTTNIDASSGSFGLIARYVDASNFYMFYYSKSSGAFKIIKNQNGSFGTPVVGAAFTWNTDTDYNLKAEVNGSALKVYVNGALQVSTTDSSFSSGKIGLRVYYSDVKFDDIVVNDFTGATPIPTPTPTPAFTPTATSTPVATPSPTPTIEVIVDNTGAELTGTWTTSNFKPNYYGSNYLYRNSGAGSNTVRWRPNITTAGNYAVYYWLPDGFTDRATNAPFTVYYNGGSQTYTVNEQPVPGGSWILLGIHNFTTGTAGYVELTDNANGTYVIGDAVRYVKQ